MPLLIGVINNTNKVDLFNIQMKDSFIKLDD